MKYIIVGNVAILSTRNVESVGEELTIELMGISDGAVIKLSNGGKSTIFSTQIVDGGYRAIIPAKNLYEGDFSIEIADHDSIITGTPLRFFKSNVTDKELKVIPSPAVPGVEIENMWQGMVAILETVIEHIDEHKNGYEVI